MGRHSCCYKQKLRKGLWSPDEDEKLLNHITNYGHGCWSSVPKQAGLQRCGKSCRLRWINYLRPDLKRGTFSQEEENIIIELHSVLGNRWSQIAAQLPGRTDNEIKNLWNSCLKKKLRQKGIDPITHKPFSDIENEEKEEEEEETMSQEKESDELNHVRLQTSYEQKQSSMSLKSYANEMEGSSSSYLMENSNYSSQWFNQAGLMLDQTFTTAPKAIVNSESITLFPNSTESSRGYRLSPPTTNTSFVSNYFCYKPSLVVVPSEDVSISSGSWNEYLHNPMLMLPNQAPESLCNQIKPALVHDALEDILPYSKQQESSQSYSIAAFEHV